MNQPSATPPDRDDYRDQELALLQERQGAPASSSTVAVYRLVHRAIRAAPLPEPPADFAARIAAQVTDARASDRLEALLQRATTAIAGALALAFSAPHLGAAFAQLAPLRQALPLPMLLAAATGIALAAAIERLASHRRDHT